MDLIKTLPRIAAKILHNTHVGPSRMKEKFSLLSSAYGRNVVEEDFEKWCKEQHEAGLNPRYPLSEYIKVVDERLGSDFVEPSQSQFNVSDERILPISSLSYELAGYLPSPKVISILLKVFESEEITEAFKEYVSFLNDLELKTGAKRFFTEGGAAAVIHARRQRK